MRVKAGDMMHRQARNVTRISLIVLICSGLLTFAYGQLWVPVRDAAKVDAILSPEEVKDPQQRAIVQRALKYESVIETDAMYAVLGIVTALVAGVGLVVFEIGYRPSDST